MVARDVRRGCWGGGGGEEEDLYKSDSNYSVLISFCFGVCVCVSLIILDNDCRFIACFIKLEIQRFSEPSMNVGL